MLYLNKHTKNTMSQFSCRSEKTLFVSLTNISRQFSNGPLLLRSCLLWETYTVGFKYHQIIIPDEAFILGSFPFQNLFFLFLPSQPVELHYAGTSSALLPLQLNGRNIRTSGSQVLKQTNKQHLNCYVEYSQRPHEATHEHRSISLGHHKANKLKPLLYILYHQTICNKKNAYSTNAKYSRFFLLFYRINP